MNSKYFILATSLLCISFSTSSFAKPITAKKSGGEKFIASALKLLLKKRCKHYRAANYDMANACYQGAQLLPQVMDGRSLKKDPSDAATKNNTPAGAIFANETAEILESQDVRNFISETLTFHQSHSGSNHIENLWTWTLKFTGGDSKTALKWLAILFQDTDALAHIQFLYALYGQNQYREDIKKLAELNLALKTESVFSLFPVEISNEPLEHSRALYHFYVVGYLALKLGESQIPFRQSAAVPFIFNTTYEYFRHQLIPGFDHVPTPQTPKDFSPFNRNLWRTIKQFYRPTDPRSIQIGKKPTNPKLYKDAKEEFDDLMNDAFMGYAGAFFGSALSEGLNTEKAVPLSYAGFVSGFSAAPWAWIHSQFFE